MNARAQPDRAAKKAETRRRLLAAALTLSEHASFDALSLREVTREAGVVPAAFYRHFADLDELGLALVDESYGALREMIRAARTPTGSGLTGEEMTAMVMAYVAEHRDHFRFLARERFGGHAAVRAAINAELELFARELAIDLGRMPALRTWSTEDVVDLADLIVTLMARATNAALELDPEDGAGQAAVVARAERQLALLREGIRGWGRR